MDCFRYFTKVKRLVLIYEGTNSKNIEAFDKRFYCCCNDNSGAKELMIIGAIGIRGVRSRYPSVGIGSIIITSVRKGNPDMVKKSFGHLS